jgi:hypothetical protein
MLKLFLLLSIITASVSFLVIQSKLFQFFRNYVRECPVFKCGVCFGHWIALVLVIGFKARFFETHWFLDTIFSTLAIAWVGGIMYEIMTILVMAMESMEND